MKIEKYGLEELITEELKGKTGEALDRLWEEPWVKAAMDKSDRRREAFIQETAQRFRANSDIIVIVADGALAGLIDAAVSALPAEDGPKVRVFGSTLSPLEYGEILTELQEADFSLIAVSEGEESVPLRGAYTCLKQLLLSKYGPEGAGGRIIAVAGKESRLLAMEAADNDYPAIPQPDGVSAAYAANTEGVLLPLAAGGAAIGRYLDGFYDMLASPFWDLDGADYGIARAAYSLRGRSVEEIQIWQKQLRSFGFWQELAAEQRQVKTVRMPVEKILSSEENFRTTILIEEDEEDIMMPYFEGCNQDGSLNMLLKETAEREFAEEDQGPKIKLSVEQMDAYALGQLLAFAQLSNGITEYLLKA